MSNEIQIFKSEQFGTVRIREENGKPLFCGKDVAKALGYSKPENAIATHCRSTLKRGTPHPQSPSKTIEMSFIPESDVYRLVFGSKLPNAEKFTDWVTEEVLPSIRKNGAYLTYETAKKIVETPEFLLELAQKLKDEQDARLAAEEQNVVLLEENENQQKVISELQPKGTYYDIVLSATNAIPITLIAKDYGLSAKALNEILHDLHIQFKSGGSWVLYQPYANKGYTKSYTAIDKYGHVAGIQLNWTQSGRLFIYETLKHKMGLLPICELSKEVSA